MAYNVGMPRNPFDLARAARYEAHMITPHDAHQVQAHVIRMTRQRARRVNFVFSVVTNYDCLCTSYALLCTSYALDKRDRIYLGKAQRERKRKEPKEKERDGFFSLFFYIHSH